MPTNPEVIEAVLAACEGGRRLALENPDQLAQILADEAGLTTEVAPAVGTPQRGPHPRRWTLGWSRSIDRTFSQE